MHPTLADRQTDMDEDVIRLTSVVELSLDEPTIIHLPRVSHQATPSLVCLEPVHGEYQPLTSLNAGLHATEGAQPNERETAPAHVR